MSFNINLEKDGNKITVSAGEIIKMFHMLYYGIPNQTWMNTKWLGQEILKCPLDLWIYQEMFYELKPDIIIESGTYKGASAHFYATLCDILGKGKVISIDIEDRSPYPEHNRLTYLNGSTTDKNIVSQVKDIIKPEDTVLIILDSDHSQEHVAKELEIYSDLVSVGSYIVVEDSNVNGHPTHLGHGPGPFEALHEFLNKDKRFEIDLTKEKFMMTFNPHGYLKRIK